MHFEPEQAFTLLARTPHLLDAWLRDLPAGWLDVDEGPGTYSPRDVVGHLIHGEETDWAPRLRHALAHGTTRPFEPFDREGFVAAYRGRPIDELLDRFAHLRAGSLAAFREATAEAGVWDRRALHPALGEVTLGQLLASWTVHDLGHVRQIARAMARAYADAVGPWRAYLTILDRPQAL
ncbi:MAG: DinB family protein [Vicinamibacteria bacterium]|nr:DinB family protein [Vicinamibacteria bacterium]